MWPFLAHSDPATNTANKAEIALARFEFAAGNSPVRKSCWRKQTFVTRFGEKGRMLKYICHKLTMRCVFIIITT